MKTRMGKLSAAIGSALMMFPFFGGSSHADSMEVLNVQHSLGITGRVVQTASGICPQKRNTRQAPARYIKKKNPLEKSPENIGKGKMLYYKDARPTACGLCHGVRGNGNGKLAPGLEPAPRNFTCLGTMQDLPDGQLFWIIQNGSPGTGMPAFSDLGDEQVWKIVLYLREFSK